MAWPIGIHAREPLTPVLRVMLSCQRFLSKILANSVKTMPVNHTMQRWVLRMGMEVNVVVLPHIPLAGIQSDTADLTQEWRWSCHTFYSVFLKISSSCAC